MIIEVILYVHMHVHYIPLIDDHHIVTYIPITDLTTGETISINRMKQMICSHIVNHSQ